MSREQKILLIILKINVIKHLESEASFKNRFHKTLPSKRKVRHSHKARQDEQNSNRKSSQLPLELQSWVLADEIEEFPLPRRGELL